MTDNTQYQNHLGTPASEKPRRKKSKALIAALIAMPLAASAVGATFLFGDSVKSDCHEQHQLLDGQKQELNTVVDASSKAQDLGTADEPVPHTKGFAESYDRSKLSKLTAEGEKAIASVNPTCEDKDSLNSTKAVVAANAALLTDLKTETDKYSDALEAYRLEQATKEAEASMAEAKEALSKAQKAADTQLKKVKDSPSLQGEAAIKKPYETLTKVSNEANAISTTVTTSTYEDAVESIAKAKEADAKAGELNKAAKDLENAIAKYEGNKAKKKKNAEKARTTNSAAPATPAPAPAPATQPRTQAPVTQKPAVQKPKQVAKPKPKVTKPKVTKPKPQATKPTPAPKPKPKPAPKPSNDGVQKVVVNGVTYIKAPYTNNRWVKYVISRKYPGTWVDGKPTCTNIAEDSWVCRVSGPGH